MKSKGQMHENLVLILKDMSWKPWAGKQNDRLPLQPQMKSNAAIPKKKKKLTKPADSGPHKL